MFINRIEIVSTQKNINLIFTPGVNVIYGLNSSGKTTLVEVLSNILQEDYERFIHFDFQRIEASFSNGLVIKIEPNKDEDGINVNKLAENSTTSCSTGIDIPSSIYLPTYRNLIHSTSSVRTVFGEFAPKTNYLCIVSLEKRLREGDEKSVQKYLSIVNGFLKGKRIVREDNSIKIVYENGRVENLDALSSGERQLLTLLYPSYLTDKQVILVDEPELSLHIDWQRVLLKKMRVQTRQIIVSTHSPMIATEHNLLEVIAQT